MIETPSRRRIRKAESRRPRIQYLWTPDPNLGGLGKIALGTAFVFTVVVGLLITLSILGSLGASLHEDLKIILTVAIIGGLIVGFIWTANWVHMHEILKRPRYRTERLNELCRNQEAQRRLTHRMIERRLRGANLDWRNYRKCLRELSAGDVVCANFPRAWGQMRPGPTDIFFEPMELGNDEERICSLISTFLEESDPETSHSSETGNNDPLNRIKAKDTWRPVVLVLSWIALLYFIGELAMGVYTILTQGLSGQDSYWFIAYAVFIFGMVLHSILFAKEWWIVPGGIVIRWHPIYRRRPIVEYFVPEDSALIVEFRSSTSAIIKDRRAYRFECTANDAFALLLAWLSATPRPTRHGIECWASGDRPRFL